MRVFSMARLRNSKNLNSMPAKVDPNKKINVTELVNSAVRDADNEVRLHVDNVTDLANKDKDDFFSVLSRY